MRKSGNANPIVCANNLLHLFRGEVPYERVKGLDPRAIDRPTPDAEAEVIQDAHWLLGTYEPRVEVNGIGVTYSEDTKSYAITADLTAREV